MTTTLTDDLFSQLQGQPLAQTSQQLGLPKAQIAGAISATLPLLLGALGRNTSQPQGADALFGALQRDHTGLEIGSVLGSVAVAVARAGRSSTIFSTRASRPRHKDSARRPAWVAIVPTCC